MLLVSHIIRQQNGYLDFVHVIKDIMDVNILTN